MQWHPAAELEAVRPKGKTLVFWTDAERFLIGCYDHLRMIPLIQSDDAHLEMDDGETLVAFAVIEEPRGAGI
jgi:hypothetical protein